MRLLYLTISLLCLALASSAKAAPFSFVAIGDTPYLLPAQYGQFERLTTRINAARPAFTIHVGDIKSGSTRCEDAHMDRIRAQFDRFEAPLVYTPGDNEWTDCHRADNGGYDPIERLARVRSLFFDHPGLTLGAHPMKVETQSADPRHATYVENVRFQREGVWFATAHIIGSNNNLQRNQAAVNEYIARNAANIAWINQTFAAATTTGGKAVVIAFQADPFFQLEGSEDQRSGFTETIATLKAQAVRFGRPVLIIHGDKHRLLIDKPLYQNRKLIYNATRLMVFGENEVQAVEVGVDPDREDVFSFRTLTVRENLATP
jgi:hypothetical protein